MDSRKIPFKLKFVHVVEQKYLSWKKKIKGLGGGLLIEKMKGTRNLGSQYEEAKEMNVVIFLLLPPPLLKIYLFERAGAGDRGGGRESQVDSKLSMEPNAGLSLRTLRL